jgi:hypothetical protein
MRSVNHMSMVSSARTSPGLASSAEQGARARRPDGIWTYRIRRTRRMSHQKWPINQHTSRVRPARLELIASGGYDSVLLLKLSANEY